MILVAALLITSCPLSTLAIDEAEMVEMSLQEAEQEGSAGDEADQGVIVIDNGNETDAVEAEGTQDSPEETGAETESVVIAETGVDGTSEVAAEESIEAESAEGTSEVAESESAVENQDTTDAAEIGDATASEVDSNQNGATEETTEASISELPSVEFVSEAVDGVIVTVSAPEGVFPQDAKLVVERVTGNNSDKEDIDAAVENAKLVEAAQGELIEYDDEETEVDRHTFDIKIVDAQNNELQPTADVQVKFTLADQNKPIADANVYHLEENTAAKTAVQKYQLNAALAGDTHSDEETEVSFADLDGEITNDLGTAGKKKSASHKETEETEAVELKESSLIAKPLETTVNENTPHEVETETSGFSYYVVEFFYDTYKYVLEGDGEVELSVILSAVGINIDSDTITKVEVSDDKLFVAEKKDDVWYIKSLKAFSTNEWLKVHAGDVVYEIKVTDDTATAISNVDELIAAFSNGGKAYLIDNIEFTDEYEELTINEDKSLSLDLNGYSVDDSSDANFLNIEGELMIIDSVTDSTGTFNLELSNTGNVTIGQSTILGLIGNAGTLIVDGGVIMSLDTNTGTITVYGGEIMDSITNSNRINISGGTINGKITNGRYAKKSKDRITGHITISGGNFAGQIVNSYGSIEISGGLFTGNIDQENNLSDNNNYISITNGKFDVTPNDGDSTYKTYYRITGGSFKNEDIKDLLSTDYEAVQNAATQYWNVQYRTDLNAARIGNITYKTLESAIASASEGDTIELLRNIVYSADNGVEIYDNNITLDFNGFTYTGWICAGEYKVNSSGVPTGSGKPGIVTIKGSNTASPVILEVMNGSKMTIEGGNFSTNPNIGKRSSFITVYNRNDYLTVNGGTFNGKFCNYGGNITVNNGNITGSIIHEFIGASTILNGGTLIGTYIINQDTVAIWLDKGGNLTVNYTNTTGDIFVDNAAQVVYYGGDFTGDIVCRDDTSYIDIYDGVFNNGCNFVRGSWKATITLHGGKYYEVHDHATKTPEFRYTSYIAQNEGLSAISIDNKWWRIGKEAGEIEAELWETESAATWSKQGTLQEMLDAATVKNNYVKVVKDISHDTTTYVVQSGVILDINGHKIEAHGINAAQGYLVDRTDGASKALSAMGSLDVFSMAVSDDNAYMPIYDTSVTGYRLFEYSIKTTFGMGTKAKGSTTVPYLKCQYKLGFTNTNAKPLLAQKDSNNNNLSRVNLNGYVFWHLTGSSTETKISIDFGDANITKYGNSSATSVFYISLIGVGQMAETGRIVKTYPVFTVDGVSGMFTGGDNATKYAQLAKKSDGSAYAYYTTKAAYDAQTN